MGIAQALKGVGIMSYPIMVQFFMDKYGFRGTMAVLAAINSHAILGMLAFQPVEWHQKLIKIPLDEVEPRNSLLSLSLSLLCRHVSITEILSYYFSDGFK